MMSNRGQKTIAKNLDNSHSIRPVGAYTKLDALVQLRFAARDLNLFNRNPSLALHSAQRLSRFRGRGMEFEEVRHYQAGDDIRSIDWRITARTQVPHTKLYREERERPALLLVDQRSPMFFGSQVCFKSVLAAHVSAALAWAALAHNDRVGGLIFSDHDQYDIRPKRSKHTILEFLNNLHRANHQLQSPISQPGTATKSGSSKLNSHKTVSSESAKNRSTLNKAPQAPIKLSAMLTEARRLAKPGSTLFVVSDFHDFDKEIEEPLFRLKRHCDITLIQIADKFEQKLPDCHEIIFSDGSDQLRINGGDKVTQLRYQNRYQRQQQEIERLCTGLSLPLITMKTDDDPIRMLHQVYGRARKS